MFPQCFPLSYTGNIVSSASFCFQDAKSAHATRQDIFNENQSMRALAKISRPRANEHSSNFCEQFKQRPNFASTFKLEWTIQYSYIFHTKGVCCTSHRKCGLLLKFSWESLYMQVRIAKNFPRPLWLRPKEIFGNTGLVLFCKFLNQISRKTISSWQKTAFFHTNLTFWNCDSSDLIHHSISYCKIRTAQGNSVKSWANLLYI